MCRSPRRRRADGLEHGRQRRPPRSSSRAGPAAARAGIRSGDDARLHPARVRWLAPPLPSWKSALAATLGIIYHVRLALQPCQPDSKVSSWPVARHGGRLVDRTLLTLTPAPLSMIRGIVWHAASSPTVHLGGNCAARCERRRFLSFGCSNLPTCRSALQRWHRCRAAIGGGRSCDGAYRTFWQFECGKGVTTVGIMSGTSPRTTRTIATTVVSGSGARANLGSGAEVPDGRFRRALSVCS